LVGWNSAEVPYQAFLGADAPTPENYGTKVKAQYSAQAAQVLKLYPGNTEEQVIHSATALASDRFIAFSTWKWADLHSKTGGQPVYRYIFSKTKPPLTSAFSNTTAGLAGGTSASTTKAPVKEPAQVGAPHAFEIEYAMGNLNGNPVYAWTADDHKVSATMLQYFANFIKTGNPNGGSLPKWTALPTNGNATYMNIGVQSKSEQETTRARYLLLEQLLSK
jgi:para-nitrobenzyl esterase